MFCITRLPFTPLSRAISHRRRHDVWVAMWAAGAADVRELDVDAKRFLKSERKMYSLLFFDYVRGILRIREAFSKNTSVQLRF